MSTSRAEHSSLVTIDRIPFPRPDDPLLTARRELLGAAAFAEIDLPRAAMLLAQATGRLIRNATDRGVVAVFDPRLGKASYRWQVVNALPPMKRTRERSEVEAFLREITTLDGVQSPVVGQLVGIATVDGIATITLDSPANRNALSQQLLADLHTALDRGRTRSRSRHRADPHRARLLRRRGPEGTRGGKVDSTSFVRAIERLGTIAAPVIAAVDGPVRAGGIGVMAACDLVVVNPSITFAFTEVRIGVAPAIISAPILQRCGWSKLAAPFLTGEAFDAAERSTWGWSRTSPTT